VSADSIPADSGRNLSSNQHNVSSTTTIVPGSPGESISSTATATTAR